HERGAADVQRRRPGSVHRTLRRRAGRDVYRAGSPGVGHEHEPSAYPRLGRPRRGMDGALDLLPRASTRHAGSGRALPPRAGRGPGALRQAPPRYASALPVPLWVSAAAVIATGAVPADRAVARRVAPFLPVSFVGFALFGLAMGAQGVVWAELMP